MIEQKKSRSGMRASTAYNHQARLLKQVQETYSLAVQLHLTYQEIAERLDQRVYSDPAWSRLPSYVQTYIFGWLECKRSEINRYHMVWLMSVDGQLLTSKEMSLLDEQERKYHFIYDADHRSVWARCNMDLSRHVWCNRDGIPLKDKPHDGKFKEVKP